MELSELKVALTSLKIVKCLLNIIEIVKNKFILKNKSHYFKNYHKHLTIYKDGTGILINSFDIVFNKKHKEEFKRAINISDGKITANFPPFEDMKKVDIHERFYKYGFWEYSEDNIISSSKERYWNDMNEEFEDANLKNDDKELRWVFRFNYSRIKNNKPYHMVYILSIPDMFPITDGKLDLSIANDATLIENKEVGNSSSMRIRNRIKNFQYTVSFENGIKLETEPECDLYNLDTKKEKQKLDFEHNIIYNKYTCNIKNPKLGSMIKIAWRFSD